MQRIPLIDSPRQTMQIPLGGDTMRVVVWWSPLSAHWYLSIATDAGADIALGRQITPSQRLIRDVSYEWDIVAIPRADDIVSDIGRQGWGVTHDLYYLTGAEVASVEWGLS